MSPLWLIQSTTQQEASPPTLSHFHPPPRPGIPATMSLSSPSPPRRPRHNELIINQLCNQLADHHIYVNSRAEFALRKAETENLNEERQLATANQKPIRFAQHPLTASRHHSWERHAARLHVTWTKEGVEKLGSEKKQFCAGVEMWI
ncbi:hypothetical protein BaRGS_00006000 [Batillaria attramentaria]|uniref:Uncharacterized protein n=1 Tax=Batillaria attramentaria TaxID=370345 RepID=A0ABD0LT78_9CAEN